MTEFGRIFIVEDEPLIAMELRDRLETIGHDVLGVAARGDVALDLVTEKQPEVVFLDIQIAGPLDGIDVAQAIGRLEPPPAVVYTTAYADTQTLARAKVTEPLGYLVKPYSERDLRATIEMALYRSRVERERAQLRRDLAAAQEQIKVLSGFLPICSHCRRIRDEETGAWTQLESYITRHSEAVFSHGLCDTCLREHYPDMADGAS